MLSRLILTCTAALLFALGLLLDFLPQETAASLNLPAAPGVIVLLQVLAGALLGLGYLNWLSRSNPMGGIYSRPLALCNLLFFAVSAITLLRATARNSMPPAIGVAAAVATVFALAFIWLMFFHDPTSNPRPTPGAIA